MIPDQRKPTEPHTFVIPSQPRPTLKETLIEYQTELKLLAFSLVGLTSIIIEALK